MERTFEERYYKVSEVAKKLKVNRRTVRWWYWSGKLPYEQVGRLVRIYGPDLNIYLGLDDEHSGVFFSTRRRRY